jgi:hypothetical protein
MKAFATFQNLRDFSKKTLAEEALTRAFLKTGKTIFLSHSSLDNEFLPGVLDVLEKNGGRVYVDKRDKSLDNQDIIEVANRLRDMVRACRKFVLFVTTNSKDSNWIPWELGLGDGVLRSSNVALFPSAETAFEQAWSEREYLGLYQRIIWGNFQGQHTNQWLVLNHRDNTARTLSTWLTD